MSDNRHFLLSKGELYSFIKSCQRLEARIIGSDKTTALSFRQLEKLVNALTTYECVFTYIYVEIFKYGKAADVIDTKSIVFAKYTLSASLVFSEPTAFIQCLDKLPASWEDIKELSANNDNEYLKKDIETISKGLKAISFSDFRNKLSKKSPQRVNLSDF